ncbi:mitochondrial intermediate peptidase isoform X1 [Tribolium madens]|uniref:mitochondrial intermediate peptidase isoform X1 n=2 Tax=Tribolium madens TaxID=41895 RepID=UPI001CF76258|nr:mitochondrial intermediate peptidase isoform X1 [Tribolium madens]
MFATHLSFKLLKTLTTSNCNVSRWSALEKIFNTKPGLNLDIVTKNVGLFGVSQLTTHEGFYYVTQKCVEKTDDLVREALSSDRKRKMVEIFDELSDSLCQVADLAEFIRFAHPSSEYIGAAEHTSVAISKLVERLNTNIEMYKALKTAVNTTDIVPTTEVDNLVGKLFLFDFEQCGIHLNEHKRNQVVELNNKILCAGQQFLNGISNPKVIKQSVLPESVRDVFSSDGDKVIISGLYADSSNPLVREMAYKIFLYPDPNQEYLLNQLLDSRHELALACDFDTYSERALRGSILDKPPEVMELLEKISESIKSKAMADFSDMSHLKMKENPNGGPLAVWDVPYFTQKAKRDRFEVTSKEYSPYFSLGACMEGLNLIFNALYGISLVNSEIASGETWSKDVYKLSVVHETEGLLGYIYCDFYERNFKPNQECHFTIRGGKVLPDGTYQLPIVVLMLNFPLPRWSSPTLLSPNMVDNLFHEMGHAMHSMLARTQYQHVSGTRCSTDFAEVPSILMEYFASDPRVIKLFAKHFQTKEPIPEPMLVKLCASKNLFSASETQLQIFYAALDQIYHGKHPLSGTTTEILAETQNRFYGLPYVPHTTWQLRFSHLVGYGAKYYSYLVSRALAYLIWETYFKVDPLSRVQGERYRRECLAHGGGKNPTALIGDYLKVTPTPGLLANSLNSEIESSQGQLNEMRNYCNKL